MHSSLLAFADISSSVIRTGVTLQVRSRFWHVYYWSHTFYDEKRAEKKTFHDLQVRLLLKQFFSIDVNYVCISLSDHD